MVAYQAVNQCVYHFGDVAGMVQPTPSGFDVVEDFGEGFADFSSGDFFNQSASVPDPTVSG